MAMSSAGATDIDSFIAQYPPATQKLLKQLRVTIHKAHKGFEEAIAYGIPTFRLNKRNVVHFSGYDRHIGFYPGASGIARFMPEFKGYKTSKGTVQFPLDAPLPVELITRIVKWCAAEAEVRSAVKKKPASVKKGAIAPVKKASKTVKKKP
jgi:uncharacterized protein YdhG (YjbR/CyaY superfamily)